MGFLSGFMHSSRHHASRKPAKRKTVVVAGAVFRTAFVIGVVLFFAAFVQLMNTLMLSVSKNSSLFDVYSRNFTSIVGFALIGLFLVRWCYFNSRQTHSKFYFTYFKVLTLVAASLCILKSAFSVHLGVSQLYRGPYVYGYYFSDVIAWLAVGIFLISYYYNKITRNGSNSSLKFYAILTMALAVICLAKTVPSGLYTMTNYHPRAYPWIYYLADTVAWFFLFIFFTVYSQSKLVSKAMHKIHKRDTSYDDKANNVARTHADTEHHYTDHASAHYAPRPDPQSNSKSDPQSDSRHSHHSAHHHHHHHHHHPFNTPDA